MVAGRLSPLVTAETPGLMPHRPQEPRGSAASEPISAGETRSQTHHTVRPGVLRTTGTAGGEGTGPRDSSLRLPLSKNSGFQGENARKD